MSHKRQRLESGTADSEASSASKRDEFLVTLGNYGTISLAKAALQAFPTSLLTMTLLGDGVDEHSLYVPIGRGLESFPRLIKEILDCGVPPYVPPLGVHFDLFMKWLRYLGLATAGREISTESEEGKRVSYFVETIINTARCHFKSSEPNHPRYGSYVMTCVCIPPDIKRHLHDLVPFEFSRRGMHMSVKDCRTRNPDVGDVDVSTLFQNPTPAGDFMLKSRSSLNRHVVTGVYPFPENDLDIEHNGSRYHLCWLEEVDPRCSIVVAQRDAGGSFDGRTELESFVVIPYGDEDLLKEFEAGGMVYNSEKHGKSILETLIVDGKGVYAPFIHGIHAYYEYNEDVEVIDPYVLVLANDLHPPLTYCVREDSDEAITSTPYRFVLEESPEWALENNGQPPEGDKIT